MIRLGISGSLSGTRPPAEREGRSLAPRLKKSIRFTIIKKKKKKQQNLEENFLYNTLEECRH
jgi:hypothetical protein